MKIKLEKLLAYTASCTLKWIQPNEEFQKQFDEEIEVIDLYVENCIPLLEDDKQREVKIYKEDAVIISKALQWIIDDESLLKKLEEESEGTYYYWPGMIRNTINDINVAVRF